MDSLRDVKNRCKFRLIKQREEGPGKVTENAKDLETGKTLVVSRNIIKVSVNGVKEKVVQDEAGDEATVQE